MGNTYLSSRRLVTVSVTRHDSNVTSLKHHIAHKLLGVPTVSIAKFTIKSIGVEVFDPTPPSAKGAKTLSSNFSDSRSVPSVAQASRANTSHCVFS